MSFRAGLAREMGLTARETAIFRDLSSPSRIQDFLLGMPINHEHEGDTCHSVRVALRHEHCHCIEACFIAACAMLLHGRPALLMDLQAADDHDHVVALFRLGRHWGAISKSNSVWLRWRDPVYASPRELAMSYFHEYVRYERKTLRRASRPFDIGAYHPDCWVTAEDDCWDMAREIDDAPHFELVSAAQARRLRPRDRMEVQAGMLREFNPEGKRPF